MLNSDERKHNGCKNDNPIGGAQHLDMRSDGVIALYCQQNCQQRGSKKQ